MPKKRTRHHVNPLNFRPEPTVPDWATVFADPSRPLEVDVGAAKGTFLLARAAQAPDRNLVGLEIRLPMVERARRDADKLGLENVHVIFGNANADFARIFAPSSVDRVYVHFPDPWFKTRHHKRRVMTPAFLDVVGSRLKPGGELHFMTDYEAYAAEAAPQVEAHPAFENALGRGVMATEPLVPGILSDREAWHMSQGDPVYRYLFRRKP
ncbi:MAG: tRNA (guanosine(46)-N7)-methyltransferase TrmB [Planctomycetota bacterium]